MRSFRLTPLMLATLLGVGVWGVWPRANLSPAARPAPGVSTPERGAETRTTTVPRAHATSEFPPSTARRPTPFSAPVKLTADEAALTAEVAALQLLALDSDLELQTPQWTALAAATLKIQAIRQAYEATIATSTPLGDGRFRVEVPAYPVAGDRLRAVFQAELREQLGDADASDVIAHIGGRLEGRFAGFGVSVQTLDITVDRSGGGDDVVTRTIRFWNSVENAERLTTRRETHFPGREDPTGELWRPLLALVAGRS